MAYKDKTKQAEYAHKHYLANKEKIKQRAANFTKQHRKNLRDIVKEKKQVPCKDCGKSYPHYVMDFDHLHDKINNIANLVNKSISVENLLREIKKCEVVCANCHRERTWSRRDAG